MIEKTTFIKDAYTPQSTVKTLRMVKNERMGGYVPKWETQNVTPQTRIENNLTNAKNINKAESADNLLAYGNAQNQKASMAQKEFTFNDVLDMVNPLQHIPIVSQAYRSISGDDIKPIGKIIGGSLYGGALGGAAGLINVIIQDATGKSVTENALNADKGAKKIKIPSEFPNQDKDLTNALLAFNNVSPLKSTLR